MTEQANSRSAIHLKGPQGALARQARNKRAAAIRGTFEVLQGTKADLVLTDGLD